MILRSASAKTSATSPANTPSTTTAAASRWPSCRACAAVASTFVRPVARERRYTAAAEGAASRMATTVSLEASRIEQHQNEERRAKREPRAAAVGEVERGAQHGGGGSGEKTAGQRTGARRDRGLGGSQVGLVPSEFHAFPPVSGGSGSAKRDARPTLTSTRRSTCAGITAARLREAGAALGRSTAARGASRSARRRWRAI